MMTYLLASMNKLRNGSLDAKEWHLDRLRGDEERPGYSDLIALPDVSVTVPVSSGDWWIGVES